MSTGSNVQIGIGARVNQRAHRPEASDLGGHDIRRQAELLS